MFTSKSEERCELVHVGGQTNNKGHNTVPHILNGTSGIHNGTPLFMDLLLRYVLKARPSHKYKKQPGTCGQQNS